MHHIPTRHHSSSHSPPPRRRPKALAQYLETKTSRIKMPPSRRPVLSMEGLRVAQLKDMCREKHLSQTGKKADLIARLNAACGGETASIGLESSKRSSGSSGQNNRSSGSSGQNKMSDAASPNAVGDAVAAASTAGRNIGGRSIGNAGIIDVHLVAQKQQEAEVNVAGEGPITTEQQEDHDLNDGQRTLLLDDSPSSVQQVNKSTHQRDEIVDLDTSDDEENINDRAESAGLPPGPDVSNKTRKNLNLPPPPPPALHLGGLFGADEDDVGVAPRPAQPTSVQLAKDKVLEDLLQGTTTSNNIRTASSSSNLPSSSLLNNKENQDPHQEEELLGCKRRKLEVSENASNIFNEQKVSKSTSISVGPPPSNSPKLVAQELSTSCAEMGKTGEEGSSSSSSNFKNENPANKPMDRNIAPTRTTTITPTTSSSTTSRGAPPARNKKFAQPAKKFLNAAPILDASFIPWNSSGALGDENKKPQGEVSGIECGNEGSKEQTGYAEDNCHAEGAHHKDPQQGLQAAEKQSSSNVADVQKQNVSGGSISMKSSSSSSGDTAATTASSSSCSSSSSRNAANSSRNPVTDLEQQYLAQLRNESLHNLSSQRTRGATQSQTQNLRSQQGGIRAGTTTSTGGQDFYEVDQEIQFIPPPSNIQIAPENEANLSFTSVGEDGWIKKMPSRTNLADAGFDTKTTSTPTSTEVPQYRGFQKNVVKPRPNLGRVSTICS
ncbi:unnamed protein product [Amoebophrya sp. A25]|nr:unnamed protein product [Amoebophrya sp. A25]|eukprot:GSA25T00018526001.1